LITGQQSKAAATSCKWSEDLSLRHRSR